MGPTQSPDHLPSVTCVCLTFNRPDILKDAVEDFLKQDYAGVSELVVFNTHPLQELVYDHPRITVVNWRPRPATLGACRNLAVQHASNEVVIPWDDDDRYRSDHVSKLVRDLGTHEALQAHGFMSYDCRGPSSFRRRGPMNQVAFRRNVFHKVGGYPEIDSKEDRALLKSFTDQKVDLKVVHWTKEEASLTYNTCNSHPHVSWMRTYEELGKVPVTVRGEINLCRSVTVPEPPAVPKDDVAGVTVYYNMSGYHQLLTNYHTFKQSWREDLIPLWTVEVLLEGRTPEITGDRVLHVYVREPFFHKESAINYGVSQLPPQFRKVVWSDCDLIWEDYSWMERVSPVLEDTYSIQLWDVIDDLDRRGRVAHSSKSVLADLRTGRPGGAWASHREFFEKVGLYNWNVVGGGDTVCSMGLGGWEVSRRYEQLFKVYLPIYRPKVTRWVQDAIKVTGGRAELFRERIRHLWHGDKSNRQYMSRHALLDGVNPKLHLECDANGFVQWVGSRERNEKILEYFLNRKEQ